MFRWALVSLTSMSACALLSSKAVAGCHYPGSSLERARSAVAASELTILRIAELDRTAGPGRSPWAPSPGRPCSGPNCSNRSGPSQAPFSVSSLADEEWCLDLTPSPRPALAGTRHPHFEPRVLPYRDPRSIERPPRSR